MARGTAVTTQPVWAVEWLTVRRRRLNAWTAASSSAVDDFLEALPASVEPATREIARRAAELRARHGTRIRLPDALVVATAIVLEARRVVTTDARWPDLGLNVEVIGHA